MPAPAPLETPAVPPEITGVVNALCHPKRCAGSGLGSAGSAGASGALSFVRNLTSKTKAVINAIKITVAQKGFAVAHVHNVFIRGEVLYGKYKYFFRSLGCHPELSRRVYFSLVFAPVQNLLIFN